MCPQQSRLARFAFPFLGLFFALQISALSSFAVCPVPHVRANAEYFKRDAMFVGTVTPVRVDDDETGWFYDVRVEKLFRGPKRKSINVYTENTSWRFPLELNQRYLLFASWVGGQLTINNCGNSALASQAAVSIQEIAAIALAGNSAEIEGWVQPRGDDISVAGVRVIVRGKSRKAYTAVTDHDGWFHMTVPPGRFHVDFSADQYYSQDPDFGFFWYAPHHFVVHAGECAVLQLVSVRRPAPPGTIKS